METTSPNTNPTSGAFGTVTAENGHEPNWSPKGDRLVTDVVGPIEIWIRSADGQKMSRWPRGRDTQGRLDISLTIHGLSLHPDGTRFATALGTIKYDLWIAEGFAQPATGLARLFHQRMAPPAPARR